jgi:hypothetical protein
MNDIVSMRKMLRRPEGIEAAGDVIAAVTASAGKFCLTGKQLV